MFISSVFSHGVCSAVDKGHSTDDINSVAEAVNPSKTILSPEKSRVWESPSSLDLLPSTAATPISPSALLALQRLQQRELEHAQLLLRQQYLLRNQQQQQQQQQPVSSHNRHGQQQQQLLQSNLLQDLISTKKSLLPSGFEQQSQVNNCGALQNHTSNLLYSAPLGGTAAGTLLASQLAAPPSKNLALLQQHANDQRRQLQQRKLWHEILQASKAAGL